MTRHFFLFTVAIIATLFILACGDDTTPAENDTSTADVTEDTSTNNNQEVGQDIPVTEVEWPATCQEYAFQESSYITSLHIPVPDEDEPCCYDMGGPDGEIDNKISVLLASLAGLLEFDANAMIAEQIAAGTIVVLLEFREFDDGAADDPSIVMPFFYGSIDGCTEEDCSVQADAAAGNGTFLVSESSFLSDPNGCTGTPFIKFDQAYVEGNHLVAGPSIFGLSLPIMEFVLEVEIHNSRVEADLSYGPNGITMTNGKLGGAIPVGSVIDGLNQYASGGCTCLEIADGDLVTYEITSEAFVATCSTSITNNCEEDDPCKMIGDMCGMAVNLIAGQADIDTDGDGVAESISIGITLEGTSAQVSAP